MDDMTITGFLMLGVAIFLIAIAISFVAYMGVLVWWFIMLVKDALTDWKHPYSSGHKDK